MTCRPWIRSLVAAGVAALLVGCTTTARTASAPIRETDIAPPAASPGVLVPIDAGAEPAAAHAESATAGPSSIERDPVAYLRSVLEKTRQLQQYKLLMVRQERRGLISSLRPPERIACWFRRAPFSVRMKWLDDDTNNGETVYVEGRDRNRVRFIPRFGFLGLSPRVFVVDVQTPVIWGVAKRPISEFGLERMMERTLATLAENGDAGRVRYLGLRDLPYADNRVHAVELAYPSERYAAPVQELLIDPRTDLPAGSILKLADGRVDSIYTYDQLELNVTLGDDDFVMDGERQASRPASMELPAARTQ
ncbi:MAG: DUF1571 domain-containing protein [Phycisphaerae bacterium]